MWAYTARRTHRYEDGAHLPVILLYKIPIMFFGLLAVVLVESRVITLRSWAYILSGRRIQ